MIKKNLIVSVKGRGKQMKHKKMLAVASVAAFTLLLAGCNTTNNKGTTATSDSVAKSSESKTKDPVDLNSLDLPQLDDKVAEDQDLVQMVTSMGNIEIKLFPKQAPKTVENFMKHAKDGYYDGLTFHRVINNFMIQGGDPSGDGTGGNSIWNKPFEDEFSNQLYNIRGALSMANAGPNTNGSQFFIVQNTDDQSDGLLYDDYPKAIIDAYKKGGYPSLDKKHTVFGQVTKGMDIVDKIAKVEVGANDKPKTVVKIEKINILQEAKK
ncbi:TPA: peptidylprolyl isomerase [Enterococcus faecalis]|nr:peptidylprolyl isomerase [Enterococcus faecalis]